MGRLLSGIWNGTARGLGRLARSIGDTHEADSALRRDGVGLGLFCLAVIVAASFWASIPGLLGEWIRIGTSTVIGPGPSALSEPSIITEVKPDWIAVMQVPGSLPWSRCTQTGMCG